MYLTSGLIISGSAAVALITTAVIISVATDEKFGGNTDPTTSEVQPVSPVVEPEVPADEPVSPVVEPEVPVVEPEVPEPEVPVWSGTSWSAQIPVPLIDGVAVASSIDLNMKVGHIGKQRTQTYEITWNLTADEGEQDGFYAIVCEPVPNDKSDCIYWWRFQEDAWQKPIAMSRGILPTSEIGPGTITLNTSWDDIISALPNDSVGFCSSWWTVQAPNIIYKDGAWVYKASSGSYQGCNQLSMIKDDQKDAELRKVTFQGVLTPEAASTEDLASAEVTAFKTAAKTFRLGAYYNSSPIGRSSVLGITNEEVALTEIA